MSQDASQTSAVARKAVGTRDWATVGACADEILRQDRQSPEGHFLAGLVAKAAGRPADAVRAFSIAIKLDGDRYDAAMELAAQYVALLRHDDALDLLRARNSQTLIVLERRQVHASTSSKGSASTTSV